MIDLIDVEHRLINDRVVEDRHLENAMEMFNVSAEEVTPQMRSAAKARYFSEMYSAKVLAFSNRYGRRS